MVVKATIQYLQQNWEELIRSYGDNPSNTDLWWENIVEAYSEPHREYHTLSHLGDAMGNLFSIARREDIVDFRWAEWAIWFHDYVYNPQSKTNEADSADVAEKCLRDLGFGDSTVEIVRELILMTKLHGGGSLVANMVSDADMAILSYGQFEYSCYLFDIRKEYGHLTDQEWEDGRSDWIEKTLAKPYIFHTEAMRKTCEKFARDNLENELSFYRMGVPLG